MDLKLIPKLTPSQKQNQLLMLLPKMQQAMAFLQAPLMELSTLVKEEMQHNPLLEEEVADDQEIEELVENEKEEELDADYQENEEVRFDADDFEVLKKLDEEYQDHFYQNAERSFCSNEQEEKNKLFLENSIQKPLSLYEFLMEQAHQTLQEADRKVAEQIIGNLDNHGFLGVSLEELSELAQVSIEKIKEVLAHIQTFDPPGIGALDVRESLLIQLRRKNKESSLAYQILFNHFEQLLHNKIPLIARALHTTCALIESTVAAEIAKLDLKPGALFSLPYTSYIVPDATLEEVDGKWVIRINQDELPELRLNRRYLRLLDNPEVNEEAKNFIRLHLQSAKWLVRNLFQRNQTLYRVLECLLEKQKNYLSAQEGELLPLIMKEVANTLQLHESTIARAVANKYILTPRGILPMRHFFSNHLATEKGEEKSTAMVREYIKKIIEEENKEHPFSDEQIVHLLKERGVLCARRTVAKYRRILEYGNAHQRRKYA